MQEVTTEMREKGINSMEWVNREEWKENTTLRTGKCETIDTLYIQWVAKLLGTHITQNKYYDFNSNPI